MLFHPIKQNNSSLYESSIRLSSSFLPQNITLKQTFPRKFKKQIWTQISKFKPQEFISQQQHILSVLLNDQEKFHSQFKLFYNNHLTIYQWHALASQKHFEIKDYVFTKLLKRTCADYKLVLKSNMNKIAKNSMQKQSSKYSPNYFLRSSNHTPKPSLSQIKKSQSLPNSIYQSSVFLKPSSQPQQFSEDYHELFIKTLDACDGFKYIHYDFCRHQKGYESKNLYNKFIRIQNRKKSFERLNTFHEELKDASEGKQNFFHRRNVFNKTFSFLKPDAVHNGSQYSKFQMIPFQNAKSTAPNISEGQNIKMYLKTKASKTHVLKKMPHQFGKQKPPLNFTIKVCKSPVVTQPIRT